MSSTDKQVRRGRIPGRIAIGSWLIGFGIMAGTNGGWLPQSANRLLFLVFLVFLAAAIWALVVAVGELKK